MGDGGDILDVCPNRDWQSLENRWRFLNGQNLTEP